MPKCGTIHTLQPLCSQYARSWHKKKNFMTRSVIKAKLLHKDLGMLVVQ